MLRACCLLVCSRAWRPAPRYASARAPLLHGSQWRGLARAGPTHDGQPLTAGVLGRKLEELGARAQAMQQVQL